MDRNAQKNYPCHQTRTKNVGILSPPILWKKSRTKMIKLPRKTTWKYSHEEKRYNWKQREEKSGTERWNEAKESVKVVKRYIRGGLFETNTKVCRTSGEEHLKSKQKNCCVYTERKREKPRFTNFNERLTISIGKTVCTKIRILFWETKYISKRVLYQLIEKEFLMKHNICFQNLIAKFCKKYFLRWNEIWWNILY